MLPHRLVACCTIAVIAVRAAELTCHDGGHCENDDEFAVELLQRRTRMPQRADLETVQTAHGRTELSSKDPFNTSIRETPMCTPLFDEGASFTVLVQLGTTLPGEKPQSLALVVDTGSNAMVVSSCMCNLAAVLGSGCAMEQPCFRGDPSVSPTFKASNSHIELEYGSGAIQCDVGTDYAMLEGSNIRAYMRDGLFLLQDRHELHVGPDFLGIVGLGMPSAPGEKMELVPEKLFMQAAGVPRYSVCFNGGGIPGALKTGMPPFQKTLTSTGVYHWGVGMTGLRAGSSTSNVVACASDMEGAGTQTPCGIIPDSGTTQILGPVEQVLSLFENLCAAWPRCKSAAEHAGVAPSADMFHILLWRCGEWLTDGEGVREIPSIFFDMVGAYEGEAQTIELTAWSWVIQVENTSDLTERTSHARALMELHSATESHSARCLADIDTIDYPTTQNGPIWILGQALFLSGTIGYDITSYPPALSFDMDCWEIELGTPYKTHLLL
eukprot:265086-Amphidinium_carterae.1